jgi:hypothetical protein
MLGAQHANGGDTRTVFDEIEQAQHEPSLSEHPAGVSQIDGGVHRETHADEPIAHGPAFSAGGVHVQDRSAAVYDGLDWAADDSGR